MTRVGLLWDEPVVFSRFLEDCGVTCQQLTPQLLAAPFFRGSFAALVIPAGFANPAYSRLLPALRAVSARLRRFLEEGGRVLVFGAGIDRPDAYNWLPFAVTYRHEHLAGRLTCESAAACTALFSEYDPDAIECDGYFPVHEGEVVARMDGHPVVIRRQVGRGEVVATTIHEYPSKGFMRDYCSSCPETLF
mgnify:CR=1 FL=1|jgi:hypothetical protein